MFAGIKQLYSRVLFSDVTPLIRTGVSRLIGPQDMPALPAGIDPRTAAPDFTRLSLSSPVRFLLGLIRVVRRDFAAILVLGLASASFDLASPLLVRRLLSVIAETTQGERVFTAAVVAAIGLCLVNLGSAIFRQHMFSVMLQNAQRVVNGLNVAIFRHALRLTRNARTATPIGDLVNHMSTDTDNISEVPLNAAELIINMFTLLAVVGLLIWLLGAAGLVAIAVLLLLLPFTRSVARRVIVLDDIIMKKRDERVSLVSQVVSGIRIVKYFAWESRFRAEIEALRQDEIGARRRLILTESLSLLFYAGTTIVMALGAFGTYLALGGRLDAPLVFSCVFLFNLLHQPFGALPNLISQFAGAKVAADRIQKFLGKETYAPDDRTMSFGPGQVSVRLDGLSVRYPEAAGDALQSIDLSLRAGEKLAVVGPVGCGKSTLLNALLGELEPRDGTVRYTGPGGEAIKPRLAYASQEPFIMNASLRRNIVFGEPGSTDAALSEALEAAALVHDVALLPAGLDTEIGEHGVNLSGGQRQRVSLARAVLRRPDCVLLDDPLSAVDEATEDVLVDKLVCGAFARTTLVMTTHRLRSLRRFDRIAFLEGGRLIDCGTHDELEGRCGRFRDFLVETERRSGASRAAGTAAAVATSGAPAAAEASGTSRITEDEDRESGAVAAAVYLNYARALGGTHPRRARWILAGLIATTVSLPVINVAENAWLARWMNALAGDSAIPAPLSLLGWQLPGDTAALAVYGAIGLVGVALIFVQFFFWAFRAVAAGKNYHDCALQGVLRTRIRFFDATPVGRILNRFSRDVDAVERELTWSFAETVRSILWTLGSLVVIVAVLPLTTLCIIPALLAYHRLQKEYRATARETKRLHSITRSPRYAHFKETLQGLTVLRAFSKQEMFLDEFYRTLSENQRMFYGMVRVNRWFSVRIPILSGVIALAVVIGLAWMARDGMLAAGTAGLVLTYTLSFWGSLNWSIRAFSEAESRLTSVERLLRYAGLPPEPRLVQENSVSEAHRWPLAGDIVFDHVRARYDESLPEVLKGVTFHVPEGNSVGIIGRTGSGKSTLFQVLFRLIDVSGGRVLIDGHDIRSVPLELLRRSIATIPQDPMLFKGTLRSNLDRFEIYSDDAIWASIQRIGLRSFVAALPGGLAAPVEENGHNFSQGQRQLFCLARALLTRARIIVLDEATASVDVETDSLIQHAIREECAGITRLIIAHRTETLAECDKIIEMADGVVSREYVPTRLEDAVISEAGVLDGNTRPGWIEGIEQIERPFRDPTGEYEKPKSLV